jgi:MFS family permease
LGSLSDRIGRILVVKIAYVFVFLGLICISQPVFVLVVLGVVCLAIVTAILNPVSMAIVGDIAAGNEVVTLTAFIWLMRNVGIISSLLLSKMLSKVYILPVSFVVATITLGLYWPYIKNSFTSYVNYSRDEKI